MLKSSSKLWRLDAVMLSVVPGKQLGGPTFTAQGLLRVCAASGWKTKAERYFCFSPFSIKVKILFKFLSVNENSTR